MKHTQRLAGRDVYVQWSSDGDDGRVELIHVPLVGAERTLSAEQLAAIAAERISGLVDAREEHLFAGASESAHLVPRRGTTPRCHFCSSRVRPMRHVYVSYRAELDQGR